MQIRSWLAVVVATYAASASLTHPHKDEPGFGAQDPRAFKTLQKRDESREFYLQQKRGGPDEYSFAAPSGYYGHVQFAADAGTATLWTITNKGRLQDTVTGNVGYFDPALAPAAYILVRPPHRATGLSPLKCSIDDDWTLSCHADGYRFFYECEGDLLVSTLDGDPGYHCERSSGMLTLTTMPVARRIDEQ